MSGHSYTYGRNEFGLHIPECPIEMYEYTRDGIERPRFGLWLQTDWRGSTWAIRDHRGFGSRHCCDTLVYEEGPFRSGPYVETPPPSVERRHVECVDADLPRSQRRGWLWSCGTLVASGALLYALTGHFVWPAIIALVWCHEMGHFVVAKRKGLQPRPPIFLGFIGAFVSMRKKFRSGWDEGLVALAGPVVGIIPAVALHALYLTTGYTPFVFVAFVGYVLNGANLIPVSQLDGGRIAAAFCPWLLVPGFFASCLAMIWWPDPIIALLTIGGAFQVYRLVSGKPLHGTPPIAATAGQKRALGIATGAAIAFMALAGLSAKASVDRDELPRRMQHVFVEAVAEMFTRPGATRERAP